MINEIPVAELHPEFSSPDAAPTPWGAAHEQLERAEIFWLTTVWPDGRPHVTPLIAVWREGALYFCTGAHERKAKNLAHNPNCILTTGCNSLHAEGLDVVIEGQAQPVTELARLRRIAQAYVSKYGEEWRFLVTDDGLFLHESGESTAVVYEVAPIQGFGFGRGASYSQTRWRF